MKIRRYAQSLRCGAFACACPHHPPPSAGLLRRTGNPISCAHHYSQIPNALKGNPKGIVSSSPGLRACELPWEIVQIASQPQRGCGRARHPRTQPRWGWLSLMRGTQGSSCLATLGFVTESLRDSRNFSPETWVLPSTRGRIPRRISPLEPPNRRRVFSHSFFLSAIASATADGGEGRGEEAHQELAPLHPSARSSAPNPQCGRRIAAITASSPRPSPPMEERGCCRSCPGQMVSQIHLEERS